MGNGCYTSSTRLVSITPKSVNIDSPQTVTRMKLIENYIKDYGYLLEEDVQSLLIFLDEVQDNNDNLAESCELIRDLLAIPCLYASRPIIQMTRSVFDGEPLWFFYDSINKVDFSIWLGEYCHILFYVTVKLPPHLGIHALFAECHTVNKRDPRVNRNNIAALAKMLRSYHEEVYV